MSPCDVIVVEKERWSRRADSEGFLLITVDFSDNTTLLVYYITVESYGHQNGQFSVVIRSQTVLLWACL